MNSYKNHADPSSVVGDSLLWKNARKNDTKNRISETINRIIPHRSPLVTIYVVVRCTFHLGLYPVIIEL